MLKGATLPRTVLNELGLTIVPSVKKSKYKNVKEVIVY